MTVWQAQDILDQGTVRDCVICGEKLNGPSEEYKGTVLRNWAEGDQEYWLSTFQTAAGENQKIDPFNSQPFTDPVPLPSRDQGSPYITAYFQAIFPFNGALDNKTFSLRLVSDEDGNRYRGIHLYADPNNQERLSLSRPGDPDNMDATQKSRYSFLFENNTMKRAGAVPQSAKEEEVNGIFYTAFSGGGNTNLAIRNKKPNSLTFDILRAARAKLQLPGGGLELVTSSNCNPVAYSHPFHAGCIGDWRRTTFGKCPICREPFKPDHVRHVLLLDGPND